MARKRYRVGIDVGLYSVGLSAVEIDDSFDNPLDAYPVSILSSMSYIHDGGIDPDSNKTADSRKAVSGVARRARKLNKRKRERLGELDKLLIKLGYPVSHAKKVVSSLEGSDPYFPWKARISLAENKILDERERNLAICVAIRHIARHRGWRNPYSGVSSLEEAAKTPSKFYIEFFERMQRWRWEYGLELEEGVSIESSVNNNGKEIITVNTQKWMAAKEGLSVPTAAQLIEPLLKPLPQYRIRTTRKLENEDVPGFTAQMGKLHQSDYYAELLAIFKMQEVPCDNYKPLFEAVFKQINPKDVGAAAELVAKDDLQPDKKRASRASLAFQRYRILTTITNLRIQEEGSKRSLDEKEIQKLCDYLCSEEVSLQEGVTWHDVADVLKIERNQLKGVGGITADGDPISAQTPPFLSTEYAILKAKGISKELRPLKEWWERASALEKEWMIEFLGNAGLPKNGLSPEESAAKAKVQQLAEDLGQLEEGSLEKLDAIKLSSGRASYSVNTLERLSVRMYEEGLDLHSARKVEFGVDDGWRPTADPLGKPTGNPAVDRTIKQVARWLRACDRAWGKPETINLEHVREGFISEKAARDLQNDMNRRFKANLKVKEGISQEYKLNQDSINRADVRRYQAIQRQNSQCLYCGCKIDAVTAQMDHIVPRKGVGSSNVIANLVATCASCNKAKSNTLFYTWASPSQRKETVERVNGWIRDSYFANDRAFRKYKNDVKARLNQKEEDEAIDNRSIESVAWMARELKEQIEGYFGYIGAVASHTEGNSDFTLQRVSVFRGWITSEARKASGLEKALPWIGGSSEKERLDRRHHAIDAAVIAFMRPEVARILAEREELKRSFKETHNKHAENQEISPVQWKKYYGKGENSDIYLRWRDEQMASLSKLLSNAMEDDKIVVTNPLRLRLGYGRAHEDTVFPLISRKVGNALTPINIDKASSPALWLALTAHPDYSQDDGLPEDWNRRIRIHDRWLDAYDEIGFMAKSEKDFEKEVSAVYLGVRDGFAGAGSAIHHARFYRILKLNSKGEQTGWEYAYMRVYQVDLLKKSKEDLFAVELPPQSNSVRNAVGKLRVALREGTAEYLNWAVIGDEVEIDLNAGLFNLEGAQAINKFLRAFPKVAKFKIVGFGTNTQMYLRPAILSSEGVFDADLIDSETKEKREKNCEIYSDYSWNKEDIDTVNAVIKKRWSVTADKLLSTHPKLIRRNTLGMVRWKSNNRMPLSWKVPPHPPL